MVVKSCLGSNGPSGAQWLCWSPPPSGIVKLNFDEAVWEDGGASIGCVAHDETGKLLLIAGVLCLYDTILEAERRGAWEAL